MYKERNSLVIGTLGENYAMFLLNQIEIDAISIDRTYDLFLWKNMHRVEVKTSYPHLKTNNIEKTEAYQFHFNGRHQRDKDAFDYAICIGCDKDYNPKDVYVIPQPYIVANGKSAIYIPVRRSNTNLGYFQPCNNYDKFRMLCKDNLDVFKQSNKSAFTRKKNELTKKLLNYEKDCISKMKKEFETIYSDRAVVSHKQEAMERLGISHETAWKWAKELGKGGKWAWTKTNENRRKKLEPKVLKLWRKGHTRLEMSKIMGISKNVIAKICNKLTLPKYNPYRDCYNNGKPKGAKK